MVDEQKLRQLAMDATPGPWITEDWASKDSDGAINVCGTSVMAPQALCGIFTVALEGDGTEDVDYIAAANPAAILSLLDELQTLREERTAWRVTAENAEKDATRYRRAMSLHHDDFAVCERDGDRWYPIDTDAPIDSAIKEAP
jgi:hypothetical protein